MKNHQPNQSSSSFQSKFKVTFATLIINVSQLIFILVNSLLLGQVRVMMLIAMELN